MLAKVSLHPSWKSSLHVTTLDSINTQHDTTHTEVAFLRDAYERSGTANQFHSDDYFSRDSAHSNSPLNLVVDAPPATGPQKSRFWYH